jgi:hypothetical protein
MINASRGKGEGSLSQIEWNFAMWRRNLRRERAKWKSKGKSKKPG